MLLPAGALAQETLDVALPDDQPKVVWLCEGVPNTLPDKPDPAAPKPGAPNWATSQYKLQLPDKGADSLAVWDPAKGVVAVVPLAALKASPKVLEEDFLFYEGVTVRLLGRNGPPASGLVRLKDRQRQQEALLSPAGNGEVRFALVRKGEVTVSGMVSSNGKSYEFAPKKFVLDAAAPAQTEGASLLAVALPVDVDLAASPAEEKAKEDSRSDPVPSQPAAEPGSAAQAPTDTPAERPGGSLWGALVGLIVAVALVGLGIRYLSQRRDWVRERLEQMGVQVFEAPSGQQAPPKPPQPQATEQPQTIRLEGAQPAAAAVAVDRPRLVSAQGAAFDLPEGVTEVGREVSGLAIPDEPTVSRRHAQIERSGPRVVVRDLGSTNGTTVNGVKITGDVELRPGDTVQFGAARYRFEG